MKLVFSPKAADDLEEIGDYIARDNPARALSFCISFFDRNLALVFLTTRGLLLPSGSPNLFIQNLPYKPGKKKYFFTARDVEIWEQHDALCKSVPHILHHSQQDQKNRVS